MSDLDSCQQQERGHQPAEPLALTGYVQKEQIAFVWVILGSGLQGLDRARDCRDRGAQLVRRVGHEFSFGAAVPFAKADVLEQEDRRARLPGRNPVQLQNPAGLGLDDPPNGVRTREQVEHERGQLEIAPGIRERVADLDPAEEDACRRVGVFDDQVVSDL